MNTHPLIKQRQNQTAYTNSGFKCHSSYLPNFQKYYSRSSFAASLKEYAGTESIIVVPAASNNKLLTMDRKNGLFYSMRILMALWPVKMKLMGKKKWLSLLMIAFALQAMAQSPARPNLSGQMDMNKLMKMSPEEREAYRQKLLKQASMQAKQMAEQHQVKLDETILPDFEIKPPVKDLSRLSRLPLQAPSRAELMAGVQQSLQQIKAASSPASLQQLNEFVQKQQPAEIEKSSIALWYQDKPLEAAMLAQEAVLKNPEEMIGWNNLAALYNMGGVQEKAIPILMHFLEKYPQNSLLLNNMGQAYLGLGDMNKAGNYLQQCLAQDPDNPEANRSMAMISYFNGQKDKALQYFEKELETAHRRSTLALMKKMGMPINLNSIRKRRAGIPHRDYFSEIGLHKFDIPDLPTASGQSQEWHAAHAGYLQSLIAEMNFWKEAGKVSQETLQAEGKQSVGLYADLVDEMNRELGDEYIPTLGLMNDNAAASIKAMLENYNARMNSIVCPSPPNVPGGGAELALAYQKKCCDMRKPIADAYVSERNAYIKNRISIVCGRWKQYINGLISNVQLDPSGSNKRMVYGIVGEYFSFLITAIQTGVCFEEAPTECHNLNMTTEEADEIIAANHNIDINCPQWLNVSLDLQVAKLSADCTKYSIEGGKVLLAGYEKNFKTGTSTLSAGVGAEQKFGIAKASIKQMMYISFDNNNSFSDLGIKGSIEGKIGVGSETGIIGDIGKVSTTVAGVEGGYTLGLNAGFNGAVKGKGVLTEFIHL